MSLWHSLFLIQEIRTIIFTQTQSHFLPCQELIPRCTANYFFSKLSRKNALYVAASSRNDSLAYMMRIEDEESLTESTKINSYCKEEVFRIAFNKSIEANTAQEKLLSESIWQFYSNSLYHYFKKIILKIQCICFGKFVWLK